MIVKFKSDGSVTGKGFSASFEAKKGKEIRSLETRRNFCKEETC